MPSRSLVIPDSSLFAQATPKALRAYRAVAGLALSAHCVQQALPSLQHNTDLYLGADIEGAVVSRLLMRGAALLPPQCWWPLAAVLALGVATGRHTRLYSALLLGALVLAPVPAAPEALFALAMACFVALWLMLLPSGWERSPSADLSSRMFLFALGMLYVNVGAWAVLWPSLEATPAVRMWAALVPASFCFPLGSIPRRSGGVLQVGLHAWLAWRFGLPAIHAALSASCILAQRPAAAAELGAAWPAREAGAVRLDAFQALSVVLAASCLIFATSQASGVHAIARPTALVLRDLGQHTVLFAFRRDRDASGQRATARREEGK